MLLVRMLNGYRTVLPYPWGCRIEECFIEYGIGIRQHSGSLGDVQLELLPAAARSDTLGVHCDQGDAPDAGYPPRAQNDQRFSTSRLDIATALSTGGSMKREPGGPFWIYQGSVQGKVARGH